MSEQTLDHKMQKQLIKEDTFRRVWQRNTAAFRQYRFYGSHIYVGRDFTCGHYAVFEDEGRIVIGDHVQMGNHVRVLTVKPLMDPMLRQKHMECIADVEIEDHVYIGHNVTILPGVHIGSCSIIGDGCVVREDVESGSMVSGDPAQCEEALSTQLAELLDQAKLCEKSSKWDALMDHINMDKMDQAVRVLGFALGVYMSYEIVKELLARKAKLEEKKALVDQYLPLIEKLSSKKQLGSIGKQMKYRRKGR